MDRFNGTHSHGAASARACAARRWHAGADGGGRTSGPGLLVPSPVRWAAIAIRNVESLRRLALLAEGRSQG